MNVCHSSRDVWKHRKLKEITTRAFECRVYANMLRAAYSGKVHAITCPKTNFLNSVVRALERERINRCVQVQKESKT